MTLKQGKNNKTYQVLSINIELLLERRLGKRIADHIEVKEVTE